MVKLLKTVWLTLSICIAFLSLANGVNVPTSSHKQESISPSTFNTPSLIADEESVDEESKQQTKVFPTDASILETIWLNNRSISSYSALTNTSGIFNTSEYPLYIQYRKLLI